MKLFESVNESLNSYRQKPSLKQLNICDALRDLVPFVQFK